MVRLTTWCSEIEEAETDSGQGAEETTAVEPGVAGAQGAVV